MKLSNKTILLFILSVAALLRFYHFSAIPFTHDEFSALFRTSFDSFPELIEKGVKIDGHPAGIQVFLYYWVRLFGMAEWVVKLPFTLMGIFSVLLIYLIAKKWLNETVALIAASFLASVQFSVMYSQIARPYVSGLFFSLLMVWYWTKLMEPSPRHFWKNSFFYILASSLCAYNHHFSLLFAAIVGFSGLFLIQKRYLLRYVLSGVFIFLIYLPHLNIFFHQLSMGGVEGWLGKPDNTFIFNYLFYIFNFSVISVLLALALVLFGLLHVRKENFRLKIFILSGCWFLLPFLIGFFYSKYFNAVLQYSVLIFSFWALFFLLFGHIGNQRVKVNVMIVAAIFTVNIYSLIAERNHYNLFYHSPYEKIVLNHQEATENHDNIVSILDSHQKITDYYLAKHHADSGFFWFDSFQNEAGLIQFLEEQNSASYLYFGCVSSNPPNTVPIIQDYFPGIVEQKNYAGGTTYLFSKTEGNKTENVESFGFEANDSENWGAINKSNYIDSIRYAGNYSYRVDSDSEFSSEFTHELDRIISNSNNFIDISVKAKIENTIHETFLVATLESHGESIHWESTPFEKFIGSSGLPGDWITIHHSMKLSDINLNHSDIILKVYVWNKGGNTFLIDDFKINVREGNPVIYGLYEKID